MDEEDIKKTGKEIWQMRRALIIGLIPVPYHEFFIHYERQKRGISEVTWRSAVLALRYVTDVGLAQQQDGMRIEALKHSLLHWHADVTVPKNQNFNT